MAVVSENAIATALWQTVVCINHLPGIGATFGCRISCDDTHGGA